jgi:hypothetical protein
MGPFTMRFNLSFIVVLFFLLILYLFNIFFIFFLNCFGLPPLKKQILGTNPAAASILLFAPDSPGNPFVPGIHFDPNKAGLWELSTFTNLPFILEFGVIFP